MEIDWVTLGAQILNFGILVLLLRRLLYGRIVDTIDQRQEQIRERLAQAERQRLVAGEEAERMRLERSRQEERGDEMLQEARKRAEEERRRLESEARDEIEDEKRRWRRGLRHERERFLRELRDRASSATLGTVRRLLEDLADVDAQRRALRVFLRRLEETDEAELKDALRGADELTVRSSFELGDEERAEIEAALEEAAVRPTFEVSPELILGLRLEAGDFQVEWNAGDYLTSLEAEIGEVLGEGAREAATEAEPR